ncbi:MAG: hypoxanthine phosphoribosyltransferase [Candidatus Hydrogenedentes bacterium]|nr:hypoxanthine phosphoribosyltransferase [Candidatus Hydrogenedentota bacterium]
MRLSETPLLTNEQIQQRVAEMAAAISQDYANREIVVVVVLKGSIIFASDLIRKITVPVSLEFIRAKSYSGMTAWQPPQISMMPEQSLKDKHVLLVEDILDTGTTTALIEKRLTELEPESVALAVLLDKPSRRRFHVDCEYTGFTIEDHFVVGYGLDLDEQHRNLPNIYTVLDGKTPEESGR